jgi:hypothetical protein
VLQFPHQKCWFHADFMLFRHQKSSILGSPHPFFFQPFSQGCRAHPPGMDAWLGTAEMRRWRSAEAGDFFKGNNTISPGKHTKNYGKSPFLMGKLTISYDDDWYHRILMMIWMMIRYMIPYGFHFLSFGFLWCDGWLILDIYRYISMNDTRYMDLPETGVRPRHNFSPWGTSWFEGFRAFP